MSKMKITLFYGITTKTTKVFKILKQIKLHFFSRIASKTYNLLSAPNLKFTVELCKLNGALKIAEARVIRCCA